LSFIKCMLKRLSGLPYFTTGDDVEMFSAPHNIGMKFVSRPSAPIHTYRNAHNVFNIKMRGYRFSFLWQLTIPYSLNYIYAVRTQLYYRTSAAAVYERNTFSYNFIMPLHCSIIVSLINIKYVIIIYRFAIGVII